MRWACAARAQPGFRGGVECSVPRLAIQGVTPRAASVPPQHPRNVVSGVTSYVNSLSDPAPGSPDKGRRVLNPGPLPGRDPGAGAPVRAAELCLLNKQKTEIKSLYLCATPPCPVPLSPANRGQVAERPLLSPVRLRAASVPCCPAARWADLGTRATWGLWLPLRPAAGQSGLCTLGPLSSREPPGPQLARGWQARDCWRWPRSVASSGVATRAAAQFPTSFQGAPPLLPWFARFWARLPIQGGGSRGWGTKRALGRRRVASSSRSPALGDLRSL